jgi:uncharacterized protein YjiK
MTVMLLAVAGLGCSEPSTPQADRAPGARTSLFARAPTAAWRLPDRLREISGLTVSPDGRLFAHDDERAIIYQLDVAQGAIIKSFSVGDGERGDFEGIAIGPNGDFWLSTSNGRLLRFREGAGGAHVDFERFTSGLKDVCEVEGLAYLASAQSLILACKVNHARDMRDTLLLYAWPVETEGPATVWRSIPVAPVIAAAGVRAFHPSSIEIDGASGRILLLSARDGALAEFSPEGELLTARRLGPEHVQAEGMTVMPDGNLVISDEGGSGHARIAVYGRLQ